MSYLHFIGIDPGPTPGIVMLTVKGFGTRLDADVIQCSAYVSRTVLWALLDQCRSGGDAPAVVAIERFVARGRADKAQRTTSDLVSKLEQEAADQPHVSVVLRSAAQVKPWATDARLDAAGLLEATKGMRHARDAAKQALFAACHDGGLPDPLSKAASR